MSGVGKYRQRVGRHGEETAGRYLTEEKGYTILARNYRNRRGEIINEEAFQRYTITRIVMRKRRKESLTVLFRFNLIGESVELSAEMEAQKGKT